MKLALIAISALALTGCNTFSGAKQDVAAASGLLGQLQGAFKPEPPPPPAPPPPDLGPPKIYSAAPQTEK